MRSPLLGLLAGLILPAALAAGELPGPRAFEALELEAEIPISGGFMAFGYDALWMAGGRRLVRVDAADNAATTIPSQARAATPAGSRWEKAGSGFRLPAAISSTRSIPRPTPSS
jgi:hypothetical protein